MDPLSRKLFKPREAREKLRTMGGIMSSSPQLANTVQKFQDGGEIVPTVAPVQASRGRSTKIGDTIYTLLPNGLVVDARTGDPVSPAETLSVHRKLQAFPETDPIQVGSGVNPSFAYGERMRDLGIGVVPERLPAYGADSFMDSFIPGTDTPISPEARNIGGLRPAAGMGLRAPIPEPSAAAGAVESGGFFDMLARSSGAARQTPDENEQMARRSAEEAAAFRAEQGITRSLGPAQAAPVEDTGGEDTGGEDNGGEDNGGEDNAPPPPPILDPEQPETFETSYEQMLERLQGVMGKKDVNTRKQAMANLAMIGLAIASGQSPNALTNIAQGALSGMQAIRAREADVEERDQAMRLAAFKMASEQKAAQAAAEARAAESDLDRMNRLQVAQIGAESGGGRNPRAVEDFVQNVYTESLKAAQNVAPPQDMLENEAPEAYAARKSRIALREQQTMFPGTYGPNPDILGRIQEALKSKVDPKKLRSDFMAQFPGVDPSLYGL